MVLSSERSTRIELESHMRRRQQFMRAALARRDPCARRHFPEHHTDFEAYTETTRGSLQNDNKITAAVNIRSMHKLDRL